MRLKHFISFLFAVLLFLPADAGRPSSVYDKHDEISFAYSLKAEAIYAAFNILDQALVPQPEPAPGGGSARTDYCVKHLAPVSFRLLAQHIYLEHLSSTFFSSRYPIHIANRVFRI